MSRVIVMHSNDTFIVSYDGEKGVFQSQSDTLCGALQILELLIEY